MKRCRGGEQTGGNGRIQKLDVVALAGLHRLTPELHSPAFIRIANRVERKMRRQAEVGLRQDSRLRGVNLKLEVPQQDPLRGCLNEGGRLVVPVWQSSAGQDVPRHHERLEAQRQ